jgi:dipeptidyl aminopeptidase/acylaminoacyl peptidase
VHGARHAVALTTARGRVTGWLPAEDDADHLWPRFSPRGDSLAFVRQSAETAQLIVRMLDGTGALQVSPAEGSVTSFAWLPDGTGLVYTHGDSASPTGVYVAGLEGRPSRLLVDAAPGLERAELRPARRVRIPRPQGPALPVWVVAPRPERAGRAVIVVRDRKGRAPDEFSPAIQFLVSHRYAVVVVDLEDGGGGRPGRRRPSAAVVLDDLALAANWMVREALAAPARIGVLGEGWLAGHVALAAAAAAPDRLRAAVSIGGATELARFDDRTPADAAARVDAVLGPRRRPADLTSLVAVLWIYGTRDPWVGPAQRVRERMLERGALAPAAFYEDETAPLRGRRTRAHALEQVVDFLMKRL